MLKKVNDILFNIKGWKILRKINIIVFKFGSLKGDLSKHVLLSQIPLLLFCSLFLQAISRYGTTSAFCRQGKLKFVIKYLENNSTLQEGVNVFHHAEADIEDLSFQQVNYSLQFAIHHRQRRYCEHECYLILNNMAYNLHSACVYGTVKINENICEMKKNKNCAHSWNFGCYFFFCSRIRDIKSPLHFKGRNMFFDRFKEVVKNVCGHEILGTTSYLQ